MSYHASATGQCWESLLRMAHPFQIETGYGDVCKENPSNGLTPKCKQRQSTQKKMTVITSTQPGEIPGFGKQPFLLPPRRS